MHHTDMPKTKVPVEAALVDRLDYAARTRLARECAKLNPRDEKRLSEEGLAGGGSGSASYPLVFKPSDGTTSQTPNRHPPPDGRLGP